MSSVKTRTSQAIGALYNRVTGDKGARVCKLIPQEACKDQPRIFFSYLCASLPGKVAVGISATRLILPWWFGISAVPTMFSGFSADISGAAGIVLLWGIISLFATVFVQRLPDVNDAD